MSVTISGEKMKKVIKWISETIQANPEKSLSSIINEASMRFDLTPNETTFVFNFYRDDENK